MKVQPEPNGLVRGVKNSSVAGPVSEQLAPPPTSPSKIAHLEGPSELIDRDGNLWPRVDPNTGRGRFFDGFA